VDVDGRMQPVPLLPPFQPGRVLPDMAGLRTHARRSAGAALEPARIRVGLDQYLAAVTIAYLELVVGAGLEAGQEQLPDPGVAARAHGVHAAVPVVEVAHHRYPFGVGRPSREAD